MQDIVNPFDGLMAVEEELWNKKVAQSESKIQTIHDKIAASLNLTEPVPQDKWWKNFNFKYIKIYGEEVAGRETFKWPTQDDLEQMQSFSKQDKIKKINFTMNFCNFKDVSVTLTNGA